MKVTIVYGCPCSGKSTYVAGHASNKDMIYDYDALLSAATTQKQHLAARHTAHFAVLKLREAFVAAATDERAIETLWICCRWPTDTLRGILKDVDTDEVFIEATRDECYARLMADDTRPDKAEWQAVIDAWFAEHGDITEKEVNSMNKFWRWNNIVNTTSETTSERTLYLEGVISESSWYDDDVTPAMFKTELMAGTGPVTLHINSPGGDCVAASMIYTMLMDYPWDVNVQIDGLAASAASVIAMAGTTVSMSPTAMMMIHNPLTTAMGDTEEMRKAIQILEEVKESIINAYHIKTGLSRAKISHLMDGETWMNAVKAKELGFCDEILYMDGDEHAEEMPVAVSFERKTAAACLMNQIISRMPRAVELPVVTNSAEAAEPAEETAAPAQMEPAQEPVKEPEPDTRVKASELEKRLMLLK